MKSLNEQIGGQHYKDMSIQPVEFIYKNNIPFIEGAIIKYLCRWKSKNGVEDLKKAQHFLEMLIEWNDKPVESPTTSDGVWTPMSYAEYKNHLIETNRNQPTN